MTISAQTWSEPTPSEAVTHGFQSRVRIFCSQGGYIESIWSKASRSWMGTGQATFVIIILLSLLTLLAVSRHQMADTIVPGGQAKNSLDATPKKREVGNEIGDPLTRNISSSLNIVASSGKNESTDPVFVDFVTAGHKVKVLDAVRADIPYSPAEYLNYSAVEIEERYETAAKLQGDNEIHLLIAVTATACSETSKARRSAIRRTWAQNARSSKHDVDVMFVVGQPAKGMCDGDQLESLQNEIRANGDFFCVRGDDSYDGLWNKTLGMFHYALSTPKRYTHILKTDDDVYIRVDKLLGTLMDETGKPNMKGIYKGCMENGNGWTTIRDPRSKWYFRYDEFSSEDAEQIDGTYYAAGFGYELSRDLVFHVMKKIYAWEHGMSTPPAWHKRLRMLEDLMVGALVADAVDPTKVHDDRFRPPWFMCDETTALMHLDVDSPGLVQGLYEQDVSGLWDKKPVVCGSGDFEARDYCAWLSWRNSLLQPEKRIYVEGCS